MKRSLIVYMWVLVVATGCSFDRSPSIDGEEAPLDVAAPSPGSGEGDGMASGDGAGPADFGNPSQSSSPGTGEQPSQTPQLPQDGGAPMGEPVDGVAGSGAEQPPEPMDPVTLPEVTGRFSTSCSSDDDCGPDETCVDQLGIVFCAQVCKAADACEPAESGHEAVCGGTFPDGEGFCRIPCDFVVNEDCPGDMVCLDPVPMFPAGTGTCGFERD